MPRSKRAPRRVILGEGYFSIGRIGIYGDILDSKEIASLSNCDQKGKRIRLEAVLLPERKAAQKERVAAMLDLAYNVDPLGEAMPEMVDLARSWLEQRALIEEVATRPCTRINRKAAYYRTDCGGVCLPCRARSLLSPMETKEEGGK